MIGKKLAHYEIIRSLGRGGMGEVFLARDEKLGREVALKLLPEALKADPERRSRFIREAQTVAALNHPNVVTMHAVEEAADQPFLVMEYVTGTTLDEKVPANGMAQDQFFELALSMTEAVAAAHAKGITHRDLKPQNVMIDSGGRLKVLDFGLAKLLEDPGGADDLTIPAAPHLTREGVIMGTAAYMSPEQAEGKMVDARSDVFSLGILLYQMATGRRPFQGDTQMSTMTAVLRDQPTPVVDLRPDLPRQMARIIKRCLEKDPLRRYETAKSIHYDLQVLREEVVSGEHEMIPPTAPSSPDGPSRSRPLLAGALVVALIICGVIWLQPGQSDIEIPVATDNTDEVATEQPVIVVFPFENLGPPEDAYFAAGITDEIVTSLTGVTGLRVVSRTSALHYERAGKSMAQIKADLGVDYVLDGSVRWQKTAGGGSRVRVSPQLVDATADQQIWANRYDRTMAEIFTVQTEIAEEVVGSIGTTLALDTNPDDERIPTKDMTAYHSYLRAREIVDGSTFRSEWWILATDLLEKAVARDPEFHDAWVYLSRAASGLCHFDWDRTEARLEQARHAAERAHALAPEAAYSHLAYGTYYYWGRKDYGKALESLREASRIRPNDPKILEQKAYVLRRLERYEEAVEVLLEVAVLSPQDPSLCHHLSETLAIVERYEEAMTWGEKALMLDPGQALIYKNHGTTALQAGHMEVVREVVESMPPSDDPEIRFSLTRFNIALREYDAALLEAENLPVGHEAQYETISRDLELGRIHLAQGLTDLAHEEFTRAEAVFSDRLGKKPDAGNLVAGRAIALAGMGRADEALAEIERSFGLFPASHDPWIQTYRLLDQAYIQMLIGQPADAVKTLIGLMQRQTDIISPAILGTSPMFDPLRERDDFQVLLAQYNQ